MKNKEFYIRNLPHIQPQGQIFFVTWVLSGAIPEQKRIILQNEYLEKIKTITNKDKLDLEKRIYFKNYENILHNEKTGKHYLRDKRLAQTVTDTIHF